MKNQNFNLFDKLYVGIQILDAEDKYIYINSFFEKQIDGSKKDFLNKELQVISPIIESDEFFQKISYCKKNQTNQLFDCRIVTKSNNDKRLEFLIQPFHDGVLIMSSEVSSQKKKSEEYDIHSQSLLKSRTIELLETLERECQLSKKKKTSLSKSAHDLKTPLGLIKLSIQVLKKMNENSDTEEIEKYQSNIEIEIDKLYKLIDQVIKPLKEEGRRKLFDFNSFNIFIFLKDFVQNFQTINGDIPKIELECKGQEIVILDKKILEHILSNLFRIICNYCKDEISIKLRVEERTMIFEILVEGIKLTIEKQKALFEMYLKDGNSDDESREILELKIIKQYVELMNGIIRVKIGKANSTAFTIMFPTKN